MLRVSVMTQTKPERGQGQCWMDTSFADVSLILPHAPCGTREAGPSLIPPAPLQPPPGLLTASFLLRLFPPASLLLAAPSTPHHVLCSPPFSPLGSLRSAVPGPSDWGFAERTTVLPEVPGAARTLLLQLAPILLQPLIWGPGLLCGSARRHKVNPTEQLHRTTCLCPCHLTP